ncbi:Dolichyl-phosphate-mannose-protein mannosyltransferase [Spirosomataceae bacterium TFI 002]|nr:Dolichyl-phosphate-mannose-protein mannosyltransferase [Spirosomataceae bacterium TFI 002]
MQYSKSKFILIGLLFVVGVILRILYFGDIPNGLQQDEASIAYETLSLIKTGADRWGISWPVYFISWGSGQNTLYAYLSMPFVWLFGNTDFAIRFLSLILGLGTILLSYKLIMKIYANQLLALFCALFFLFEPWHFMQSRWAFEGNIIPFFILWSILALLVGIEHSKDFDGSKNSKRKIIFAFAPIAFLFYCSAITLFIVPFFFIGFVILFWKEIWAQKKLFAYALGVLIVLTLPFLLFILKNNILKHDLFFEAYLPFSIPQMLDDRAVLPSSFGDIKAMFLSNLDFLKNGFDDGRGYNIITGKVSHYVLFMAIPGFLYLLFEKNRKSKLILFWAIASSIVPFLFISNLNRTATLQTAISLIIPIGIYFTIREFHSFRRNVILGILAVMIAFQSLTFYKSYFFTFPAYSHEFFEEGFEEALKESLILEKEGEKIAVTGNLIFNYVYAAYYANFDPALFHKSNWKLEQHAQVFDFGPFVMLGKLYYDVVPYPQNVEKLSKENTFLSVIRTEDSPLDFPHEILFSNERWRVMRYTPIKEID